MKGSFAALGFGAYGEAYDFIMNPIMSGLQTASTYHFVHIIAVLLLPLPEIPT